MIADLLPLTSHTREALASEFLPVSSVSDLMNVPGFDFLIEAATGRAHLIEMNPRATPLSHFGLGPGRDPIAALLEQLDGPVAGPTTIAPMTDKQEIAFFPGAWQADANSVFLSSAYHDVPWADPDLVRELVRLPYPERGLPARLQALVRVRGSRRDRNGATMPGSCGVPLHR